MYLTYSDYQTLGGTLDETAFDRFEAQAERHINRITHGRIESETTVRTAVKDLTFELVGSLAVASTISSGGMVSMSNDGVSATFRAPADSRKEINRLVADYLDREETADGIPLLYAGVDA